MLKVLASSLSATTILLLKYNNGTKQKGAGQASYKLTTATSCVRAHVHQHKINNNQYGINKKKKKTDKDTKIGSHILLFAISKKIKSVITNNWNN